MKELKIGETITMKCVKDTDDVLMNCHKCLLNPCKAGINECSADYRTDHKNVHFEIVENPQKEWLDKAKEWWKEKMQKDDWATLPKALDDFFKFMEEQ